MGGADASSCSSKSVPSKSFNVRESMMCSLSGRGGLIIETQNELRPTRTSEAMWTESPQVLLLRGIIGIVPITNVDDVDGIRGPRAQSIS